MSVSRFKIQTATQRCDIVVGEPLGRLPRALLTLAGRGARVAFISDAAVSSRYGRPLLAGFKRVGLQAEMVSVPSGERSKTLAQAGKLYRWLSQRRYERKSWLVALGGGVVGDLTGFVAATYLRGIPFVQVPTTLLAQVDASIGGKTAVDIPEGKNLVGAFHHPRLVWIDPSTLKSLPKAHWRNGLAEVIKYGAIRDAKLFSRLEKEIEGLLKGYSPAWTPIIARCVGIKAEVVQKDPVETRGLRALLNLGHTVGHAIEAAAQYDGYLHGEAISIGMRVAGLMSVESGRLDPGDHVRLVMLLERAGLPTSARTSISRASLMAYLARDKKSEAGTVRFVLLRSIGEAISGQAVGPDILGPALVSAGL